MRSGFTVRFSVRHRRLAAHPFNKWWLLPLGILTASALVALGIIVFEPSFLSRSSTKVTQQTADEPTEKVVSRSSIEVAQRSASEPTKTSEVATVNCSGASSTDYACYQQRYQDLVRDFGVEAAFTQLRDELTRDALVRSECHQLAHVIGRAAVDLYGDIPTTYSRGDSFCASGYYHGATEAVVAKMGADKVLEEADTLCAGLGRHQTYSFYRHNCAHGLGHGFMSIHQNELFESLETCDSLTDEWERNRCYSGVFMENVIAKDSPSHPSKYLKADQPLYPCDVVGTRYKNECYQRQVPYVLETRGYDFAGVFDLCATAVEEDFRPACYQGLGWDASVQSIKQGISDMLINGSTRNLCMLGGEHEARFNCVVGAVEYFIRHYYSDAQARAFCEFLGADLRTMCLQAAEEYYQTLQPLLDRQRT